MGNLLKHFERTKRPAAFWTLMGPLFASVAVRRELLTLHDNPESDEWFVQTDKHRHVAWFACLRIHDDSAELCHYWVNPDERQKGVSDKITDVLLARAKDLGVKRAIVVAGPELCPGLKKRVFAAGTIRGKFIRMEADL